MKISAKCEYGIQLMLELAKHHGSDQLTLKQIATDQGISEKFLGQIIIPLRNAGLVQSSRGARGGYSLTKTPQSISLAEIVEVLGEEFTVPDAVGDNEDSPCRRLNPVTDVWLDLKKTIDSFLSDVSLGALVESFQRKQNLQAFTYMI